MFGWLPGACPLVGNHRRPDTIIMTTDKISSAASYAALLLALLVIAWSASRLTWQVLEPASVVPDAAPASPEVSVPQMADPAQAIVQAHLFGRAQAPLKQEKKAAPVSRINLKLFGVLATGQDEGLAMIGRDSRSVKLYRVEDRLPGAATLLEIHGDDVLIRRNGQEERLLLDDEQKLFGEIQPSSRVPLPGEPAPSLGSLREQILEQPTQINKLMTFMPVHRDGSFVGYQLQPKREALPLFDRLGLQQGDVVTALNGVPLNSPARSVEALMRLREAKSIVATIERNGQTMDLQDTFE